MAVLRNKMGLKYPNFSPPYSMVKKQSAFTSDPMFLKTRTSRILREDCWDQFWKLSQNEQIINFKRRPLLCQYAKERTFGMRRPPLLIVVNGTPFKTDSLLYTFVPPAMFISMDPYSMVDEKVMDKIDQKKRKTRAQTSVKIGRRPKDNGCK